MIPVAVGPTGPVSGWEEAVRSAAQLLVDLGVATGDYPSACVDIVREHGPYIVLAPGLALVHARPEAGGTGVGVGVRQVSPSVEFGHDANDPVDLLLSFCSPDDTAHVHALTTLAGALADGLADRLRGASSREEVARQLEEALT
ncbi:PTS sugar transporter subunit IIA [Aeromicrobium sp. CTD01-1L150]|uniref:PTS sugar transporter subunit IIA n=1 Tax=Aeromicrobium sp. CTD01-1L150 TaxID=3341830 RepID=UPI0035C051F7